MEVSSIIILAIHTTPCPIDSSGFKCDPCPRGMEKEDILQLWCEPCSKTKFLTPGMIFSSNSCEIYDCDPKRIRISRLINPYCLSTGSLVLYNITIYWRYIILVYFIWTLTNILIYYRRIQSNREYSKVEITNYAEGSSHDYMVLNFSGNNTPANPWCIEVDKPEIPFEELGRFELMSTIRVLNNLIFRR